MNRLMLPAAAVAAAAAIVTAGCASAGASGPGSLDGAAAIAPANAVAFIAASTDLGSSEWHGVGKQFMTKFKSLAPALGGELDVAVLPSKAIVGFTQPQDSAKLDRAREDARRADACDRRLDRDRKDERSAGHRRERDVASRGQQRVHRGDEPAAERRARARVRERAGGADVARVDPRAARDDDGAGRSALPRHQEGQRRRGPPSARPTSAGSRLRVTSTSDGLKLEAFMRTGGLTARPRLGTSCIRRRRTRRRSSTRSRPVRSPSSTSR